MKRKNQEPKPMTREEFAALTPAQQRVAIANDVIKNIVSQFLFAKTGYYISTTPEVDEIIRTNGKDDVCSNIDKLKDCGVCAMGAMLISTIKFKNSADFEMLDMASVGSLKPFKLLHEVFSAEQMLMIENAFECSKSFGQARIGVDLGADDDNDDSILAAKIFRFKYSDKLSVNERLILIMQNIVDNGGEFVPKQLYDKMAFIEYGYEEEAKQ